MKLTPEQKRYKKELFKLVKKKKTKRVHTKGKLRRLRYDK